MAVRYAFSVPMQNVTRVQVMVANVNASAAYYEETYHSLQFASIARQVTTLASRDASNTPARFNSYAQRATSTLSTTADRTTAQTPSTAMDCMYWCNM